MYVLIVDYIKTLEHVDPLRAAHGEWVKKYIDSGVFLFAGPKKSKLGGVILTKCIDEKKLKAIVAEDIFVIENVAEYRIIDFDAKATAKELAFLQAA